MPLRRDFCHKGPGMLLIDCRELTVDEQLALASSLSDNLEGRAIALVRDADIVFDVMSGKALDEVQIEGLVRKFISKRSGSQHYTIERTGDTLVVHSADPLARGRGRMEGRLPANLQQCPFCMFVTPYQEEYAVHVRSHLFGAP